MAKELVVSSNRHETKVAVLEDDQLVEIYFQRANEYSLAGSIHKGRVTRVLPGMQSAFVDLGLERDTFLYVSDFFDESDEYEKLPTGDERGRRDVSREPRERPEAEARSVLPPPVEAPIAVIAPPPPEPLEEPPLAVPQTAVSPDRAPERFEEGDGRDRRGRRSRRRRNRRGFPESKYAAESATRLGEPPAIIEEIEDAAPPEVAQEKEFPMVLPGESLAKYARGVDEEPESEDVEAEASDAGVLEDEVDTVPETGAAADEPPVSTAGAAPALEPLPSESGQVTPEETPVVVSVESVEFVEELESEEPPTLSSEPVTAEDVEPEGDVDEASSEDFEDEPATPEDLAQIAAEHLAEQLADEQVDEVLEDESPAGLPETSEAREAIESFDAAETLDPAEPTTPAQDRLAANAREQSGRYMHRGSRRMRRRMRGGGPDRNEAPVAPAPVAKPDLRVVSRPEKGQTSITELLREGQEILVQIAKEPLGQKGARITSHIALPGRYCVYMPTVEHLGVSRKIASEDERSRLRRILQTHRVGIPGGFIVRTAGEGKTEEQIAADIQFLYNMWMDIRQKAERINAPALIYHDVEIVQRILRDQLTDQFKAVWTDSEEIYESVLRFVQRLQPSMVSRVKMYTRPTPIFDAFNITQELEKALRPKVWLKSGGYIVINQTEALVAIDVNTGKYVGKSNRLEDTIVKTNTDAVKEIVRQIRLRDLGGIIVVDFIDMDERKNRQKVMQALEEAMRQDRAPYKILQFNDFGLVAITRKRVKQSLERTLCAPCPACEGAGYVKSVQTVIGEILTEAQKIARAVEGKEVMLRCNPEVAVALKSNENRYLEELEETLGRPVLVTSDAALDQEKFDLA